MPGSCVGLPPGQPAAGPAECGAGVGAIRSVCLLRRATPPPRTPSCCCWEVLRIALNAEADAGPGWLGLLTDAQLRPAVALMHADPGRSWRLSELADSAALSRSHFTERFRAVSGQPPLTYLSHLRVRMAQHALRTSDVTVAGLADRLGYASESSFSHAFTRVAGTSSSRYRQWSRGAWSR